MEEKDKNTEVEQPTKSQKDLYRERFAKDYPDDNMDDEEAMYGRMNERNADYDRLKKNDDDFRKTITEHPAFGGMYLDALDGVDFVESFLSRNAKEDIMAAYDDPEMAKKLSDAQKKYIEDQASSKKLREEGESNVQESLGRFNDFCEKNGIDEQMATEIWGKCVDFYAQGLKGNFSDDLFETIYKSMNHDTDVEAARQEGELAGHNAKVKTQLARGKEMEGIPPTGSAGQGMTAVEPKPKKEKAYNPFRGE